MTLSWRVATRKAFWLLWFLFFFASREIFEDFFVLPQEGVFRREFTLSKDSKKIYFHFHQNRQQVVLKIDNPFFWQILPPLCESTRQNPLAPPPDQCPAQISCCSMFGLWVNCTNLFATFGMCSLETKVNTDGNKKHDWDLHIACLFHMPWGSWTYDLEVSRGASRSSVHSCF